MKEAGRWWLLQGRAPQLDQLVLVREPERVGALVAQPLVRPGQRSLVQLELQVRVQVLPQEVLPLEV